MAKRKETGMGADAFFSAPKASPQREDTSVAPSQSEAEKGVRRSFNLKPSILRLLDEIQIKTLRDGDKWTLSAIVERGIVLAAKDMDVKTEE